MLKKGSMYGIYVLYQSQGETCITLCVLREEGVPLSKQDPKRFYVVERLRLPWRVKAIIPDDKKKRGENIFDGFTPEGVDTVAQGRSHAAAMKWYHKLTS